MARKNAYVNFRGLSVENEKLFALMHWFRLQAIIWYHFKTIGAEMNTAGLRKD